jgi:hypothetical protein
MSTGSNTSVRGVFKKISRRLHASYLKTVFSLLFAILFLTPTQVTADQKVDTDQIISNNIRNKLTHSQRIFSRIIRQVELKSIEAEKTSNQPAKTIRVTECQPLREMKGRIAFHSETTRGSFEKRLRRLGYNPGGVMWGKRKVLLSGLSYKNCNVRSKGDLHAMTLGFLNGLTLVEKSVEDDSDVLVNWVRLNGEEFGEVILYQLELNNLRVERAIAKITFSDNDTIESLSVTYPIMDDLDMLDSIDLDDSLRSDELHRTVSKEYGPSVVPIVEYDHYGFTGSSMTRKTGVRVSDDDNSRLLEFSRGKLSNVRETSPGQGLTGEIAGTGTMSNGKNEQVPANCKGIGNSCTLGQRVTYGPIEVEYNFLFQDKHGIEKRIIGTNAAEFDFGDNHPYRKVIDLAHILHESFSTIGTDLEYLESSGQKKFAFPNPIKLTAVVSQREQEWARQNSGRLYFRFQINDLASTASDPEIVIHELVHFLIEQRLDFDRLKTYCSEDPGDSYYAIEESIADTLALLTLAKNGEIDNVWGESSLGEHKRIFNKPCKKSCPFDIEDMFKEDPDRRKKIATFLKEHQYPQVNHMEDFLTLKCSNPSNGSGEIDRRIRYVNSGVFNKFSHMIITTPKKDRPSWSQDAHWIDRWRRTYEALAGEIRCDVGSKCFDPCEFLDLFLYSFRIPSGWDRKMETRIKKVAQELGLDDTSCKGYTND